MTHLLAVYHSAGLRLHVGLTRGRGAFEGQGLVEYALIILVVALVVIAAVALFGNSLSETFDTISCGVDYAASLGGIGTACTPT
jgi:pilus assembly protein Flp/PilA